MHKFTPEMKSLERKQTEAGIIASDVLAILRKAEQSAAKYQDGDAAYDLLKKSAEAFLRDHSATHSTL